MRIRELINNSSNLPLWKALAAGLGDKAAINWALGTVDASNLKREIESLAPSYPLYLEEIMAALDIGARELLMEKLLLWPKPCNIEGNYCWERCWLVALKYFKKYKLIEKSEATASFLKYSVAELWEDQKKTDSWCERLLSLPKATLDELEDIVARRIQSTNNLENDFWFALALGSRKGA